MSDSTLIHKEWYAWIGRRVCVSKRDTGTLKYFGEINSQDGFWCGIELDEPIGKIDGSINNVRYFKCKANHGMFVPMYEVARIKSRSIELKRLSDLSKFKSGGDEVNKKTQTKKVYSKLHKTYGMNENNNILDTCHKNSEIESKNADFVADKRYVNVGKRSKTSCSRFGTEESLGILSNLLEEDGSWNLLDNSNATSEKSLTQKINDESDYDCVFSPRVKALLPSSSKQHTYAMHNDDLIPNNFNIKCTSTPKHCLNNLLDLGATVKLEHNQSYDFLHDEIDSIIAGSNGPKSMDFDLTNFKHNEILCSTSKLTIPLLPRESHLLDEGPSIKNTELGKSDINTDNAFEAKNINDLVSTPPAILNGCLDKNKFLNTQGMPGSLDILNSTYEIHPEYLKYPNPIISHNVKDTSKHLSFESNAYNSDKKTNAAIDLNSTFVLPNDSSIKESEADKTFVIDRSPVTEMERTFSTELEIKFEKKSLSIIFEKASNENLSNIDAVKEVDEAHSTSISSPKPDSNGNLVSSKHSSESIDKVVKSLNSSSKNADKTLIPSDSNFTFCINNDENKGNAVYEDVNKRHSLSSLSVKNNLPIHKEELKIMTRKSLKLPQSFSTQKIAFNSHAAASTCSTIKTKVIKNSAGCSTVANKKVEVEDKNASNVSSLQSCSKDNLKTKYASSIANVTEQFKKTLNSCKALCKQTKQIESASHVAFKITEKNTKKITARRKSVGGLEAKVVSKISYTSSKLTISEDSNVNRKRNNGADSFGFNSKNVTNTKHSSIKRRHTMLPAIGSNGTQAKRSLSKSKSDLSNGTSTVTKSTIAFTDKKCDHSSKTHLNGFGERKENARESTVKKFAPVEETLKNDSKDKKNENLSIPKRELLKPGMLSRLPVPEKSIKRPGFVLSTIEPQKSIKNINQLENPRIYKRLPLRKLQD